MRRTIVGAAVLIPVLLLGGGGCSSDKPKGRGDDFIRRLDRDADRYVQENKKKRAQEEATRREQNEQNRKRWAEEAQRANQAVETPAVREGNQQPGGQVQYVLSDKDLSFVVLNKLRQLQHRSTVSISCKDGVVQLFGEVESAEQRQRIISEIQKLPGVVKVDATELVAAGGK